MVQKVKIQTIVRVMVDEKDESDEIIALTF